MTAAAAAAARPTPRLQPRLLVYVASVVVAALVLAPLSLLTRGSVSGPAGILHAVVLAGLIAGARRYPVQIGNQHKANVSSAPEIAAVLLLPGPVALIAVAVGTIAGEPNPHAHLIQRIFNLSIAVIKVVAAGLLYSGLRHIGPHVVMEPVGSICAGVVLYVVALVLVAGVAATQLRENPLRLMRKTQLTAVIPELTLTMTGIMAALAARHDAWAALLLVAPAVIAQRALRDGVALQAQTRLALEDLADIVDMRDHYTFEHSRRVADLSRATARKLSLKADEVELITMAGRVHDVGKIGIKSSVLMKPGKLTEREWREMRSHPEVGARLISHFPQFARGREYVLHHHERFDGKGYPLGLKGEEIPFGARVMAVADAWDAMTSHRSYRRALDIDAVRAEVARCSGTQFDPRVVEAFLAVLAERPDLALPDHNVEQEIDPGFSHDDEDDASTKQVAEAVA